MAKPISHGGRDYPDYGASQGYVHTAFISDMSELAARMGSPNYFDRQGVHIFNESFENGLGFWTTKIVGDTSYIRVSAQYVSYGFYGLEMKNDIVYGDSAYVSRFFPYPYLTTVGLECYIRHIEAGEYVAVTLDAYDGTHRYAGTMKLNPTAETAQIRVGADDYELIDIHPYHDLYSQQFHAIKIVINYETFKYVRLMIDAVDHDISAYSPYKIESDTSPRLGVFIGPFSPGDTYDRIGLDNVILTLNEPS